MFLKLKPTPAENKSFKWTLKKTQFVFAWLHFATWGQCCLYRHLVVKDKYCKVHKSTKRYYCSVRTIVLVKKWWLKSVAFITIQFLERCQIKQLSIDIYKWFYFTYGNESIVLKEKGMYKSWPTQMLLWHWYKDNIVLYIILQNISKGVLRGYK